MRGFIRCLGAAALTLATWGVNAQAVEAAGVMLEEALDQIRDHGVVAAAQEFERNQRWNRGSMYLVLADFDGQIVVHTANQRLSGSNMLAARDARGRAFIRDAIDAARSQGRGDIAVRWGNPQTRRLDDGRLVIRRVPDQNLYVGSVVFP